MKILESSCEPLARRENAPRSISFWDASNANRPLNGLFRPLFFCKSYRSSKRKGECSPFWRSVSNDEGFTAATCEVGSPHPMGFL